MRLALILYPREHEHSDPDFEIVSMIHLPFHKWFLIYLATTIHIALNQTKGSSNIFEYYNFINLHWWLFMILESVGMAADAVIVRYIKGTYHIL